MDQATIYILLAGALGLFMAWGIGANDVANAMATSIGSKALTIKQAVIIAAIFEFSGAFLAGGQVTSTIRKGIIDSTAVAQSPDLLIYGMLASLIAAHTLFTMALVIVIVRARMQGMDRSLIEASADLYATPWGTFRQVTLPLLLPAVLAGFLLSFTFSFDDFIIAFFVAGSNTTLPIYVFSSIRRGITPEVNAIGTMVLAVSLTLMVLAQALLRARAIKSGRGRAR